MAHTREISKLITIIERAIKEKEEEIASLKTRLSLTKDTLSRTERELSESRTAHRQKKDEVEKLNVQLSNEKVEVKMLKSKLETANNQLASLQSELTETRATSWRRKEEVDSLNQMISSERDEIKSLKATVHYKEKVSKELEERIEDIRKIHFNKDKEAETEKRELERSSLKREKQFLCLLLGKVLRRWKRQRRCDNRFWRWRRKRGSLRSSGELTLTWRRSTPPCSTSTRSRRTSWRGPRRSWRSTGPGWGDTSPTTSRAAKLKLCSNDAARDWIRDI